jgi:hypothetical protein
VRRDMLLVSCLPQPRCRSLGVAAAVLRERFLCEADAMERIAPILAVHDTEWGQHEGAVVDPDGNVIRFGSPVG